MISRKFCEKMRRGGTREWRGQPLFHIPGHTTFALVTYFVFETLFCHANIDFVLVDEETSFVFFFFVSFFFFEDTSTNIIYMFIVHFKRIYCNLWHHCVIYGSYQTHTRFSIQIRKNPREFSYNKIQLVNPNIPTTTEINLK